MMVAEVDTSEGMMRTVVSLLILSLLSSMQDLFKVFLKCYEDISFAVFVISF